MIDMPSFVDVLRLRTDASPDRIALRFLESGEVAGAVTYAELDRAARTIAAHLAASGRPGQRAVLLFPPGPDYVTAFFGCLYAGVIAVPAYPPTDPRQLPRLLALINDAEPDFVLTVGAYRELGQAMLATAMGADGPHPDGAPSTASPRWIAVDALDPAAADTWVPPAAGPDTTAFLQYTSGTTGRPKGVVVSHGNLLTNSALIHRRFGTDADSSAVIWLPPYHDMGLIGGILQPIYGGFPVALMSPLDLLRDPYLWLRAISEFRATTSGGPNFAYDLCIRKIRPEQRETLDLSGWTLAFTGAEPVRAATLRRFAETFGPQGFRFSAFYPCYGLAEATLMVTGGLPGGEPVVSTFDDAALGAGAGRPVGSGTRHGGRELVGCGVVADGHDLAIVDPQAGTPLPDGTVGEIWVRGPAVAHGYWGHGGWPADVAGRLAGDGGQPFLRTGDLGFRRDGELFVCGRRKDVIIVRGRNHSPDDIELAAGAADTRLRPGCGAAFTVDGPDEPRLVVAYEVAATQLSTAQAAQLAASVRAAVLAAHGLAVHTVALLPKGALPKTSSGKIRRSGCRTELVEGRLPVLAVDALPERSGGAGQAGAQRVDAVRAAAAEVLGVDRVAPDQPLTGLGLDSVSAVELHALLQTGAGLQVPLERVLAGGSCEELARDAQPMAAAGPAEPAVGDDGTLTDNERAMWFLDRLAPGSRAYQLCHAVDVDGPVDEDRLSSAVERLARRHAALRTRFALRDGEPVRVIGTGGPRVDSRDATGWDAAALDAAVADFAAEPIDLLDGPAWRIRLFCLASDRHVLALATHHILTDLWSLTLLVRELADLLGGAGTVPDAPARDMRWMAARERAYLDSAAAQADADGWMRRLRGAPAHTGLPLDRARPATQSYRTDGYRFTLPADVATGVRALARDGATTPYAVLLASLYWLLYRHTGGTDLVVGTAAPGRSDPEAHGIVGLAVNTVPVRGQVHPTQTFRDCVSTTAAAVRAALSGQRYPFAKLVERLAPRRDAGLSPLFQVMLVLQQAPGRDPLAGFGIGAGELGAGGLRLRPHEVPAGPAPFELTIQVAEYGGALHCDVRYHSDLWLPGTIATFAARWRALLAQVCADPTGTADAVELVTPDEQQRLLTELSAAREPVSGRPLHAGVLTWPGRTPDAVAIVDGATTLTYAQLGARVDGAARRLRTLGVGTESRVGLLIGRSAGYVEAALAVLRAGGVFVPLDPELPPARLATMVREAGLRLVLTSGAVSRRAADLAAEFGTGPAPAIVGPEAFAAVAPSAGPLPETVLPGQAAYVLYTSGTTGTPKGVCCTHQGPVNMLDDFAGREALRPGDVCAWWTSTGFDVSVLEIFSALDAGARLEVVPDSVRLDPDAYARWLDRQRVASGYVPPFALEAVTAHAERAYAEGTPMALRRVLIGVEPVPWPTAVRLATAAPGVALLHGYGPTEDSVVTTLHAVPDRSTVDSGQYTTVPLGRAIRNSPVYLLDERQNLVPVGVPGEIWIGGAGVARGYHGRPAWTADRFRPDPWVPGARMYRTGDIARYDAEGVLRFLGRRDSQVKVRGVRIELGEVEAALRRDPRVSTALAAVRELAGQPALVGYVVADEPVPPEELIAQTRRILPASMVPAVVVTLPALPLTPNGKVDRAALPLPELATAAHEEPCGELERLVASVWSGLLDGRRVGRHDDFFALGGQSLLAARGALELGQRLGRDVPLAALFANPTVAGLAAALTERPPDADDPALVALPRPGRGAAALRAEVAALPDHLVATLLAQHSGEVR